ncbi:MAG TPA: hypothetical protein DCQ06_05095 [Myxococcales bacterium]|nr:hypothetical protein [Myxococcales bacterium]
MRCRPHSSLASSPAGHATEHRAARTTKSRESSVSISRHHRWVIVAALSLGLAIFARLWSGAAIQDHTRRLERLRTAATIKAVERPLTLAQFDLPVELHPSAAASGAKVTIGDLTRKDPVILLNFWATWCPPCLEELRSLQELGLRLRNQGVQVVAVSYDNDWPTQLAIFEKLLGTRIPAGVIWVRDPQGQDGSVKNMMRTQLGTQKLPETWVISRGRVVGHLVGAQDWDKGSIERYLRALAEDR